MRAVYYIRLLNGIFNIAILYHLNEVELLIILVELLYLDYLNNAMRRE